MFSDESIVLTGCGWVTPFAAGEIDDVLSAAPSARFAPSAHAPYWAVPEDRLADYPALAKELKRDKGAWMTAAALIHASDQASLDPASLEPERVGMVLGCALAGQLGMIDFANEVRQQSQRFVSPIHFPQTVGNYIAGALARAFEIRGSSATLSCGTASGLVALVEAASLLADGAADVVFAGGTERLSKELALGLGAPEAILGEGACLFVVERLDRAKERGIAPLAEVMRSGQRSDATSGRPTAIVSAAGLRTPGAIVIEHWTGRCLAASGAAAAAAAIAAAQGAHLPRVDAADPTQVSIGPVEPHSSALGNGALSAAVIAGADGGHRTTLHLALPAKTCGTGL